MTASQMMASSFVTTLNENRIIESDLSQWKIDKEGEEYPHF